MMFWVGITIGALLAAVSIIAWVLHRAMKLL